MNKETVPTSKSSKDTSAKISKAVQAGQKVIKEGGTKVEASMEIYRLIHDLEQDVVVQAFVDGATLTPKGALTYWYNCRRKFKKEQAVKVSDKSKQQ